VGVSLAFGLTVLTMAFAIGHISGCHLNPAVTLELTVAGRFDKSDVPAYLIAQVLSAIVASALLFYIANQPPLCTGCTVHRVRAQGCVLRGYFFFALGWALS
jgi:aquaporin Z